MTLTGPGGTGKTRLAIHAAAEAAESFPDGIWWVPLSSLRDARLARVVASRRHSPCEEEPGRELSESVAARLGGKRALLMLDNAEHLMPEVATGIAALRDIEGPTLLVTSRERLQLQGEHVYSVPSLADAGRDRALPHPCAGLQLRVDELGGSRRALRAARQPAARPRAGGRAYRRLLAGAARRAPVSAARPAQGGTDADPRQQTLRATIEWSYDLLESEEQRLFRALSVFAGGCTYEAAEAVCDADPDTLQSLLDKSLLRRREERGSPRYWMLETIRELAAEHLRTAGEDVELRRRHAEHYLDVARSANLAADVEGPMRHDLVFPERDNMRAALAWALETGDRQLGLELVVALENYWATASPEEGGEWAARLLDGAAVEDALVARALRVEGGMENILGHLDVAQELWERALEIARSIGDDQQEAILLHRLASRAARLRDWPTVRSLAEASLDGHRRVGSAKGEAQALTSLAEVATADGDLEGALALLRESHDLCDRVGFRWWQAGTLARIGALSLRLGRLDDAEASSRQALSMSNAMRDRSAIVYELGLLAEIAARSGDAKRAGMLWGAVDAEAERAPIGFWLHGGNRDRAHPDRRRSRLCGRSRGRPGHGARRGSRRCARRQRYLTGLIALNDAGSTPAPAPSSRQPCDTHRWPS